MTDKSIGTDDIVAVLKAGHYTAYNSKRAYEEIERLRAELEDYRWLCTVPLIIDTVADPDNLVQVWIGTDPPKCYRGRTVEEAIREARKAEKKTP